jgi:hypothetical protein
MLIARSGTDEAVARLEFRVERRLDLTEWLSPKGVDQGQYRRLALYGGLVH